MWEATFLQHFNSAKDTFNVDDNDYDKVKAEVIKLLRIKYSLQIINENLTLDAFKREDVRARIRVNIKRLLLIKYNYPPIKREGAVEQVIRQAELKYVEK